MTVRRARSGDAPSIEALYRELVPGDPNIRVAPEHVSALERDPNNYLMVAERRRRRVRVGVPETARASVGSSVT